ncbi:hypothetical protein ACFE04_029634 [Oxalis oulophora]
MSLSRLTTTSKLVHIHIVVHTRVLSTQASGRHSVSFSAENEKKKVVVLGTGFAAVSFLKNLKSLSYDVNVVSPRNYIPFSPLLPSVLFGAVDPRSIVEPVRKIISKKNYDVRYWEAESYKIDSQNKKVHCRPVVDGENEFTMDYDYLVIATGARINTFNTPGVEENCYILKEVEDAKRLRKAVIDSFEKASLPNISDDERKRLLHFVSVGGGPTGVEFAVQLYDFVNEDLAKLYPKVKNLVKITILEAGDHILSTYDKKITTFAEDKFERIGIDVKLKTMVVKVSDKEIFTKVRGSEEISSFPYGVVLWSTGNGNRPVVSDFMKQVGQTNWQTLGVDEILRVHGGDAAYAIGDCASVIDWKIMEDFATILSKADKNNSGTLAIKEFQQVLDDLCKQYPQIEQYMTNNKMKGTAQLLAEARVDVTKESSKLNIEEFKSTLAAVHSQKRNLPATVQVSLQQGKYLAECFNEMDKGRHQFQPFRYHHPGKFAPLGGALVAVQAANDSVFINRFGQWVWYFIYARKQGSWRNTYAVIQDWLKRSMFGRHPSRV